MVNKRFLDWLGVANPLRKRASKEVVVATCLNKGLAKLRFALIFSVVQWHPFSPLFLVAAPLKIVFPKKGSHFFEGH